METNDAQDINLLEISNIIFNILNNWLQKICDLDNFAKTYIPIGNTQELLRYIENIFYYSVERKTIDGLLRNNELAHILFIKDTWLSIIVKTDVYNRYRCLYMKESLVKDYTILYDCNLLPKNLFVKICTFI